MTKKQFSYLSLALILFVIFTTANIYALQSKSIPQNRSLRFREMWMQMQEQITEQMPDRGPGFHGQRRGRPNIFSIQSTIGTFSAGSIISIQEASSTIATTTDESTNPRPTNPLTSDVASTTLQ